LRSFVFFNTGGGGLSYCPYGVKLYTVSVGPREHVSFRVEKPTYWHSGSNHVDRGPVLEGVHL